MTSPAVVYGAALRRASRGGDATLRLLDGAGAPVRSLDATWYARLRPGDAGLVDRCGGSTVDLGCGPGRITAAVAAAGHESLGVDVSPRAVRYARDRGATVLHGDVFDPLPAEGAWRVAVLADGNIGIGGDPVRLLRRCRELIAGDGSVLVEVDPPGHGTWQGTVAVADRHRVSDPFPWAFVGADDMAACAQAAALRVVERWTEAQRWFVRLTKQVR